MKGPTSRISPRYRNGDTGLSPAKRGAIAAIVSLALLGAVVAVVVVAVFVWPGWVASPLGNEKPPPLDADPCALAGQEAIGGLIPDADIRVEPPEKDPVGVIDARCDATPRGESPLWIHSSIWVSRYDPTMHYSSTERARRFFNEECQRQNEGDPQPGFTRTTMPDTDAVGDDTCVSIAVSQRPPERVDVSLVALQGPDILRLSYVEYRADPRKTATKVRSLAQLVLGKLK